MTTDIDTCPSDTITPASDADLAQPSFSDLLRAMTHVRDLVLHVLATGTWEPHPERHPDLHLDRVSSDLGKADFGEDPHDLAASDALVDLCLAAVEAGDWSPASPSDMSILQSASILVRILADDPKLRSPG